MKPEMLFSLSNCWPIFNRRLAKCKQILLALLIGGLVIIHSLHMEILNTRNSFPAMLVYILQVIYWTNIIFEQLLSNLITNLLYVALKQRVSASPESSNDNDEVLSKINVAFKCKLNVRTLDLVHHENVCYNH
jgi:hypothetical protein